MTVHVRRADQEDAPAVADVYLRARHAAVPALPPLVHDDEDVRAWVDGVLVAQQEVWVAETGGVVVGMMAVNGRWLDHLYVDPAWTDRGVGSRLVQLAKRGREELLLWTFEANTGARRFYERHGFNAVEHTDGSSNEEQTPDVRYRWRREQG